MRSCGGSRGSDVWLVWVSSVSLNCGQDMLVLGNGWSVPKDTIMSSKCRALDPETYELPVTQGDKLPSLPSDLDIIELKNHQVQYRNGVCAEFAVRDNNKLWHFFAPLSQTVDRNLARQMRQHHMKYYGYIGEVGHPRMVDDLLWVKQPMMSWTLKDLLHIYKSWTLPMMATVMAYLVNSSLNGDFISGPELLRIHGDGQITSKKYTDTITTAGWRSILLGFAMAAQLSEPDDKRKAVGFLKYFFSQLKTVKSMKPKALTDSYKQDLRQALLHHSFLENVQARFTRVAPPLNVYEAGTALYRRVNKKWFELPSSYVFNNDQLHTIFMENGPRRLSMPAVMTPVDKVRVNWDSTTQTYNCENRTIEEDNVIVEANKLFTLCQKSINEPVYSRSVNEPVYSRSVNEPVYSRSVNEPIYSRSVNEPNYRTSINQPRYSRSINEPRYSRSINEPSYTRSVNDPIYNRNAIYQSIRKMPSYVDYFAGNASDGRASAMSVSGGSSVRRHRSQSTAVSVANVNEFCVSHTPQYHSMRASRPMVPSKPKGRQQASQGSLNAF